MTDQEVVAYMMRNLNPKSFTEREQDPADVALRRLLRTSRLHVTCVDDPVLGDFEQLLRTLQTALRKHVDKNLVELLASQVCVDVSIVLVSPEEALFPEIVESDLRIPADFEAREMGEFLQHAIETVVWSRIQGDQGKGRRRTP